MEQNQLGQVTLACLFLNIILTSFYTCSYATALPAVLQYIIVQTNILLNTHHHVVDFIHGIEEYHF